MIKFNEEIMKKVKQREKDVKYVERCLDVFICPKCGADLNYEAFDDGSSEYRCVSESCDFVTIG